jgi:predicted RNase H-like nuclease (RuvC/YqgF family)
MKNVDRFNMQQCSRVYRNSKIIYQVGKYGTKAISKINPILVFIDAAVSLGELFVSYSNYRQVKEQNKQLEIEIRTLKKELNKFQKSLELKEEKFEYELKQHTDLIEKKIKNNRKNAESLDKVYKYSKQYFFKMKVEVMRYKKEFPYSKETKEIEKKYYEVLSLYVNTTLEVIGG